MGGQRVALSYVKVLYRLASRIVLSALVVLGVMQFFNPVKEHGFVAFCHWLSVVIAFIGAGLVGLFAMDSLPHAEEDLRASLRNGFLYALFYFWLGCCILGGLGGSFLPETKQSAVLGWALGVMAWLVAAGSIALVCVMDPEQQEEDGWTAAFSWMNYGSGASSSAKPAPAAPPGGWNDLSGIHRPLTQP